MTDTEARSDPATAGDDRTRRNDDPIEGVAVPRRRSIRLQLGILLIAAALLPIVAIGGWGLVTSYGEIQDSAIARQVATASEAAHVVDDVFGDAVAYLDTATVSAEWASLGEEAQQMFLSTLLARFPVFEGLSLINGDGIEVARASRTLPTALLELRDRSSSPVASVPLTTGLIYFSEPVFPERGGAIVTISVADSDLATGEPTGVLSADLALTLAELPSDSPFEGHTVTSYLIDGTGLVLSHPSPSVALSRRILSDPLDMGFRDGLDGTPVVMASERVEYGGHTYFVVSETPSEEALAPWRTEAQEWLALVLAAFVAAVIAARALSRPLSRDIAQLGSAAARLAGGDFGVRLTLKRSDELGDLAEGFNSMADSLDQSQHELQRRREELEDAYAELERFATVAAHDLQEPIRKVQTYGSLLSRAADELSDLTRSRLSRLLLAADELEELTSRLFDYTQVFRFDEEPSPIDLGDLVEWCVARRTEEIESRGAIVAKGPMHLVTAPSSAVALIVDELVANALRFSPDEPALVVRIHSELGTEDDHPVVRVIVADNGEGFDPRFNTRVFQPFERLHAKERFGGTGMGLAIARRFALSIGGDLVAEGGSDGATFTLTLPATPPQSDDPPFPKEEGQ